MVKRGEGGKGASKGGERGGGALNKTRLQDRGLKGGGVKTQFKNSRALGFCT